MALESINNDFRTPIHQALEELRTGGFDKDLKGGLEITVDMIRLIPMRQLLVKTQMVNPKGLTATLQVCHGADHIDERCAILEALIKRGVRLDDRDDKNSNCLHRAVGSGAKRLVETFSSTALAAIGRDTAASSASASR